MMRRTRFFTLMVVAIAVVLGSAQWRLLAQEKQETPIATKPTVARGRLAFEESLLRPFSFPFAKATTLHAVARHLQETLGGPVVLDLAALKRSGITEEATVKLDLQGVRLKTGLKLLLDQVGLTYHIVPEDNLLVLTDSEGTEDSSSRILAELKTLHREVHNLQDAFDELNRSLVPMEEAGPALRKPSIIEDMPDEKAKGKGDEPEKPSRPGI